MLDENMQNYLSHMFDMVSDLRDLKLYERTNTSKNPLNHYGRRAFSQSDEDGITQEIMKRIGVDNGVFAEFGVGSGLECNTLLLAGLGWSGFWVDAGNILPKIEQSANPKFSFFKRHITLNNVLETYLQCLKYINKEETDFISFDFEGNDYYLIERLLQSGVSPKVFVVEYNAKFIPPIEWKVKYHENLIWEYDDYFGASLMSYVKLFEKHNYFLACCNSFTGANAFFIKNKYKEFFSDIPKSINDIWVEPRYYITKKYGHKSSVRTVELLLNNLNSCQ